MSKMAERHNKGVDAFGLNIPSQPIFYELNRVGAINKLLSYGIRIRSAICGPCFGAGDTTNPDDNIQLEVGEYVYLPGIRKVVMTGAEKIDGIVINNDSSKRVLTLEMKDITDEEKKILLAGSLINSYK